MRLYIDPGTGSMLFSLAIGLVSVIWFGARKIYLKLKYLTPGKTKTISAKPAAGRMRRKTLRYVSP